VNIRIIESPNRAPEIPDLVLDFQISENSSIGSIVGQVILAKKLEIDTVKFAMKSAEDRIPFNLDQKSGEITVARSLDRENHPEPYIVTVMVLNTVSKVSYNNPYCLIIL